MLKIIYCMIGGRFGNIKADNKVMLRTVEFPKTTETCPINFYVDSHYCEILQFMAKIIKCDIKAQIYSIVSSIYTLVHQQTDARYSGRLLIMYE